MNAHFDYLLQLGDNTLILSQRLGEWCGHGPVLEQDIAMTNIALDLLGQARMLFTYAGALEGKDRSEDDIAYFRDAHQFHNVLLVEQPNTDWAYTIARQFFFDVFNYHNYSALLQSRDERLAAIAEKALKEVTYHPPFAIRVLEVVKHFFSVPGVVFVLALDREQLGHSIKSMYGADMDVGGYLRRFFDLEFHLPAGNGIRFIEGLCEKFDLTGMYDQLSKMSRDRASDYPPRVLAELFNALSCSPRDQEKCFTHLALVRLAATGAARWKPMALFPVIACASRDQTCT